MDNTKTIALIEVGNDGHRTAYMRLFIASLISQNYKVLCLIPDVEQIQQWIETHYPEMKSLVTYKSYTHRWHPYKLPVLGERLMVLRNFLQIKRLVKQYEKENADTIDCIFFNYIDKFLLNLIPLVIINRVIGKKWAALLIHSGTYRLYPNLLEKQTTIKDTDYIFNSKNCLGMAVHDENIIQKLDLRLRSKVLLFPEIADLTDSNPQNEIYQEIIQQAKGRKVVGAIGLEPHKCGYEFLRIAKNADPKKYFFAFLGIFHEPVRKAYSESQCQEFDDYFNHLPENAYLSLGHINEGEDYNSIFNSFDIVFLMYHDFYNASNRLTKAAHFKKLVLTTDMGCIGDDVKTYHLGEVTQNDPTLAIEKLDVLYDRIERGELPKNEWIAYSKKHHADILNEKFKLLFD